MLPDEMWEEILKFIDVFELLKLQTVSKHWYDLISRVIQKECKWYEKCVQVVPEDNWSSILEHHTHPEICGDDFHRGRKHSELWISLYKSWIGWNTLIEKSPSIETIEIFREEQDNKSITVLDVKGSIIAIGTATSSPGGTHATPAFFYDISSKFPGDPILNAHHEGTVEGISLDRVDGENLAVSHCWMTGIQYWNLRTKAQIYRRTYRPTILPLIRSSFGYCHIVQFSSDDDSIEYDILRVERIGTGIDLRAVAVPNEEHGYIRAMCASGNKMTILTEGVRTNTTRIYTSEPNDELKLIKENELNTPFMIKHLLLFKPCIAAYVDTYQCRRFGFSVNGRKWKHYNIEKDLGLTSDVECITYFPGLLILGFESGEIVIISVKDDNGLERLNLKTMQTQTLKLDSNLIRAVAVTESNSQQYVVAVTKNKLHLVKFN